MGIKSLISKCLGSIEDTHALQLQVLEVGQGMKNSGTVPAAVRRRTHAVEEERIVRSRCFDGEAMDGRIQTGIGNTAAIELGKERPEPVGMFMIDCDG